MGGEWWMRRKRTTVSDAPEEMTDGAFSILESTQPPTFQLMDEIQGVVKAKVSTSSVRIFLLLIISILKYYSRSLHSCGKAEYEICSLA